MNSKITTIRAIGANVGSRALFSIAIFADIVLLLLLAGIWALAHFVSGWWWLLLVIYIPLATVCLVIYLIARTLINQLYPKQIPTEQKQLLNEFTDKIQRVLEARGMGWPWFAVLNVKDIIFHRELRTTKELIGDTASLKKDFTELEKKLQA